MLVQSGPFDEAPELEQVHLPAVGLLLLLEQVPGLGHGGVDLAEGHPEHILRNLQEPVVLGAFQGLLVLLQVVAGSRKEVSLEGEDLGVHLVELHHPADHARQEGHHLLELALQQSVGVDRDRLQAGLRNAGREQPTAEHDAPYQVAEGDGLLGEQLPEVKLEAGRGLVLVEVLLELPVASEQLLVLCVVADVHHLAVPEDHLLVPLVLLLLALQQVEVYHVEVLPKTQVVHAELELVLGDRVFLLQGQVLQLVVAVASGEGHEGHRRLLQHTIYLEQERGLYLPPVEILGQVEDSPVFALKPAVVLEVEVLQGRRLLLPYGALLKLVDGSVGQVGGVALGSEGRVLCSVEVVLAVLFDYRVGNALQVVNRLLYFPEAGHDLVPQRILLHRAGLRDHGEPLGQFLESALELVLLHQNLSAQGYSLLTHGYHITASSPGPQTPGRQSTCPCTAWPQEWSTRRRA